MILLSFTKQYLQNGHLPIITFFKKNAFETNNPILTFFSVLASTQRFVILVQLYNPQILGSVLIDKQLLAYVTIGQIILAKKVIANSIRNGERDINVYGLNSKLDLGLAPSRNRAQRLVIYNDFLSKTNHQLEIKFLNLLIDFCNKHYE